MKNKIPVFLGPCVLESEEFAMRIVEFLKKNLEPFEGNIDWHFKGSFDKANRTSIDSYRGPGLEAGLKIFEKIKKQFQVKTITDYHLPAQAESVASVVDVLQVPAFLCRQTDMIAAGAEAAKKYHRILKMKKGQFLSPFETKNMVEKAAHFLPLDQILLTERGNSFGYQNLVVDMTGFHYMKDFGVKVIFDATHSAQKPGALGNATGGQRRMIPHLARAAFAAGADGLFMECHPNPSQAKSDAATQVPLESVTTIIKELIQLKNLVDDFSTFSWQGI
jgi:2-dehydro-3-deoxyphosphooctonate aldolase (KDO 8-P synthase)